MPYETIPPIQRTAVKTQSVTITLQENIEVDAETGAESVAKSFKIQRIAIDADGAQLPAQQGQLIKLVEWGVITQTQFNQVKAFLDLVWTGAKI
jgi:hypothetical protein